MIAWLRHQNLSTEDMGCYCRQISALLRIGSGVPIKAWFVCWTTPVACCGLVLQCQHQATTIQSTASHEEDNGDFMETLNTLTQSLSGFTTSLRTCWLGMKQGIMGGINSRQIENIEHVNSFNRRRFRLSKLPSWRHISLNNTLEDWNSLVIARQTAFEPYQVGIMS